MPTTRSRPRKTAPDPPELSNYDLHAALSAWGVSVTVRAVADWSVADRAEVRAWVLAIRKPGNVRLPEALRGLIPQGWKRPPVASGEPERSAAPLASGAPPRLMVPPASLRPSATNARREFDAEQLALLGESIKRVGQLSPIVVLPAGADGLHEIVAGERRWRAAKLARLASVWIDVRDITAEEALEDQVEENLLRVDLNPIEEARAFESLIAGANLTQAALAKRYKIEQGTVSNKLRLLKLPEAWQQLIIAREINPTTEARQLLQWVGRPAVLEWALEFCARNKSRDVGWAIRKAVEELSRPLGGWTKITSDRYAEVALSKTDRAREDLDLVNWDGEKRAFNLTLWAELQAAGEARRAKGRGSRDEGPGTDGKESAADHKRKKEQAQAAWSKKLYRYRAAWLQAAVAAALRGKSSVAKEQALWRLAILLACGESCDRGEADAALKLGSKGLRTSTWVDWSRIPTRGVDGFAACAAMWIEMANLESYHGPLCAEQLEGLAVDLGIDFARDWRVDRAFLELHSREQLAGLAAEWKLAVIGTVGDKKRDCVDNLLASAVAAAVKCPKELAKIKPCI
jgi:ParB/RepB/Spo0J family partition protein